MNYETEFKNEFSEVIFKKLNKFQKKAYHIILDNADLDNARLNKKLAKELYNSNPSFSTYKSFKKSFISKFEKVAYLSKSKGSFIQKITFELNEEICIINKLINKGYRTAIEKQFRKTLSKALKFHKFEIARSVLERMIEHYSLFGTNKERNEILSKYKIVNKQCDLQIQILTMYGSLINSKFLSKENKIENLKNLEHLNSQISLDNHTFKCYYFFIKQILCSKANYESICLEAIEYLTNLNFHHQSYISIFRNRLLNYKIANEDFLNSKFLLLDLICSQSIFSYQWYLYALTYVRVLLYSGENNEAFKWYNKVTNSRNYITLPKDHRNEWEVLGMYVYLMVDDVERISIRKVKYNLNYNRTERSKNNINFLVAELVYNLKSGKVDIDKKIDHLHKLGKGNNRIVSFCKTLKTGKKYSPKNKGSFYDEIVAHERLVSLV